MLPVIFMALMGLAMLVYVVLDGYDLGVGMLLPRASDAEKDMMIASIGPFWDANETWLVLGVGILLVAFPKAHGMVLTALYLPVALMLVGLILRGVAFDFRVKAQDTPQAAVEPRLLRRLGAGGGVAGLDARRATSAGCSRAGTTPLFAGRDRARAARWPTCCSALLADHEDRGRAAARARVLWAGSPGRRWCSAWG